MRRLILLPILILGYSLFLGDDGHAAIIRKPGMMPGNLRNMIQGQGAKNSVDYELTAADAVRVRIKELPVEFDEKGRLKKMTPEESKKRKGDTPDEQKLAGYKIDYNVLKPGDVVQVSLSKVNKDKEAKSWSSAGNMVGTIVEVSDKLITLRVNPNGPPPAANQQGRPMGGEGKPGAPPNAENRGGGKGGAPNPGQAANKVVISSDKSQATTIMILEQAPEPENKRPKEREKKK